MELIKDYWNIDDIKEFKEFEKSLIGDIRDQEFEQRIVNTKYFCFGRTSGKAKDVVKQIKKGNFYSFLDNMIVDNHFDLECCLFLINEIKEYDIFKKYLDKYILLFDSWAHTDSIKPSKIDVNKLIELSYEYIKSDLLYKRRMAVVIYFTIIKKNEFSDAYKIIDSLNNEEEYYVNMGAAWLLCELMIKDRCNALNYFKNNNTNQFVINKAISKCRESFRISNEDKEMLLKYKK